MLTLNQRINKIKDDIISQTSGLQNVLGNKVSTSGNQTIRDIKTFTSTIDGNINGNAGTVTNGVYRTGDQTIDGNKTFSGTTSITNNVYVNGTTITPVELSYLKDTTSNIQSQLDLKQDELNNTIDISINNLNVENDLHVKGVFTLDGSFNMNNVIFNNTTVNNEIVVSTQLDISNQGTGPALKVTQFGNGDNNQVALFNAGTEGDALLINANGDVTIYKELIVQDKNISNELSNIDTSFQYVDNDLSNIDTSFQYVDTSFQYVDNELSNIDTSFQYVDTSFQYVDISFQYVDNELSNIDTSFQYVDNGLSSIDTSFQSVDYELSNIRSSSTFGPSFQYVDNIFESIDISFGLKQDNIEVGDLNISQTSGLQNTLDNKVSTSGNQTVSDIKTFTSTIDGNINGNAETVTNGVYTYGNQSIGGNKTFTNTIVGNINGNSGTVTNGVYTSGNQSITGDKTFSGTTTLANNVYVNGTTLTPIELSYLNDATSNIQGQLDLKQGELNNTIDISVNNVTIENDLHVKGDFTLDGSFNMNNVIFNNTTVNNEIVVSTQLDISNQGTGPALKVTQFGNGDNNQVALFNAGTEGDALLINAIGDVTIYKELILQDKNINNELSNIDTSFQYVDNELSNIDASFELKQDNIEVGDLNISQTSGLQNALDNKVSKTGNQSIGGSKTFTSTIDGNISGNANTVTNGVYTSGDQTVSGTKTFSETTSFTSTIDGNINGNAETVTNGVYTSGDQSIGGSKTFSGTTTFSNNVYVNGTTLTPIELSYLNGTTSNIQSQLDLKQGELNNTIDISVNNMTLDNGLHVKGNFTLDGSFNMNNVIFNSTTVNNENVVSTQLDISNQGTGPALKVAQFGDGDNDQVALFNAGTEGDALLINANGDVTIYKELIVQDKNISNELSNIDSSFQYVDNELSNIDASFQYVYSSLISGTGTGIFTSSDNENYFTDKNVIIDNSDEGFKLTVNGGVRFYDTNNDPEVIDSQNDWIQDLSENIYFEGGNVGIGAYNTGPYILDVNGGVRIRNDNNIKLNSFNLEGGWLTGDGFIYSGERVHIGNVVTDDVDSQLIIKGKISSDSMELTSDRRLKTNIKDISGIDIIRKLDPKQYTKDNKTEIGFIANDVLDIEDISFVVSKSGEYYALNYNSVFTLAVQSIKDLDEELKKTNEALEKRLEALEKALFVDK